MILLLTLKSKIGFRKGHITMFVSLELFVFFSKHYELNVRSCLIRKLPVRVSGCTFKSSLSAGVKKKKKGQHGSGGGGRRDEMAI